MQKDFVTRLTKDAVAELRSPRGIALAGMLAALHLVLNQFTIPLSAYLEVGFDFLTFAATGFLCGPWVAALSGCVTDVLGYFLRPNGPYFPGFTLSAILHGAVYGLWLYKRKPTLPRVLGSKLTTMLLFNFFLTPLWLHIMYGQAFVVLSSMRLIKNIIKFPVDTVLLMLVLKVCDKYAGTNRRNPEKENR